MFSHDQSKSAICAEGVPTGPPQRSVPPAGCRNNDSATGARRIAVPLALLLTVLGALAQLGGLVTTLVGAIRTWRQFNPGMRLFGSARSRGERFMMASRDRARRLFRRPPRSHQVHDRTGGATAVGLGSEVRASRGYRALDPDLSLQSAIAELDGRTRDIVVSLYGIRDDLRHHIQANEDRLRDAEQTFGSEVQRLSKRHRDLAVGGFNLVILGLTVTFGGVVLQTVGSILTIV
jgi:hypothetical protein